MAKVRVKLNRKEIGRLLRGEGEYHGVRDDLERRADAIAFAAGDGMEVDIGVTKNRARASVRTATPEAARREFETRDLSRSIDAAEAD